MFLARRARQQLRRRAKETDLEHVSRTRKWTLCEQPAQGLSVPALTRQFEVHLCTVWAKTRFELGEHGTGELGRHPKWISPFAEREEKTREMRWVRPG